MFRRGIILATIIAVIIGAVGLPVNVHSCTMKGEDVVAPTCGMCSTAHVESQKDTSEKNNCCKDRMEIQHTDKASSAKADIQFPSPTLLPQLAWSTFSPEMYGSSTPLIPACYAHPPPRERRNQTSYLFNSSFLI